VLKELYTSKKKRIITEQLFHNEMLEIEEFFFFLFFLRAICGFVLQDVWSLTGSPSDPSSPSSPRGPCEDKQLRLANTIIPCAPYFFTTVCCSL